MPDTSRDTAPVSDDRLLHAVLDAAASLIVVVDTEGRLLAWNRACEEVSGYTAEELGGSAAILERLIPEQDRDRAVGVVDKLARGESPVSVEVRWHTRSGDMRLISWTCTALKAADGTVSHVVGTGIDVTDRSRLERRLRHLADHDDLTGLINRRRFQEELERHLTQCRRYGMSGALLVLDLDGFKEVNDKHGHSAGDRVLQSVANALRDRLRESDIVARLGGVSRALEEAIPVEVPTPGGSPIAVSVGFAPFADGVESVDDVLSAADASMYAAKAGHPRRPEAEG
jgi:PAS domain S-box-containing protein